MKMPIKWGFLKKHMLINHNNNNNNNKTKILSCVSPSPFKKLYLCMIYNLEGKKRERKKKNVTKRGEAKRGRG